MMSVQAFLSKLHRVPGSVRLPKQARPNGTRRSAATAMATMLIAGHLPATLPTEDSEHP
jgi:hypothetical protein